MQMFKTFVNYRLNIEREVSNICAKQFPARIGAFRPMYLE